jgi:hypothetical protein
MDYLKREVTLEGWRPMDLCLPFPTGKMSKMLYPNFLKLSSRISLWERKLSTSLGGSRSRVTT